MRFFYFLIIAFGLLLSRPLQAENSLKGNADAWMLFLTDNFASVSVLEVYDTDNCAAENIADLEPLFVAYGKERDDVSCFDGRCCLERIIQGDEIIAERIISSDGEGVSAKDTKSGNTLLQSLGLKAEFKSSYFRAFMDGDFRFHLLNSRTLYGSKKYRLHLNDLYAEKDFRLGNQLFQARLGRQSLEGGVLIDGLRADWAWNEKKSKTLGVYAGLAPDPRTKHLSHERIAFGLPFHFIPDFAEDSKVKFLFDSNLYVETFKGGLNRFSLFSRSHFTPIPELSLFHYSHLELPTIKDKSISSSHLSLRAFYRPHKNWILNFGLSQFRIDRYLLASSVQYLTDDGSLQRERVGDRLDQSDRYRVDAKVSYRINRLAQPYIAGRYERRTFDSDKIFLNPTPESDPSEPKEENLRLINKKNAYGGDLGLRLNWPKNIDTDTRLSYQKRFQSSFYSLNQNISWIPDEKWFVEGNFQFFRSQREIAASISSQDPTSVKSLDFYVNLGLSYRFRSNISGQIGYDFMSEDDASLEKNIFIHSLLLRFDYRF